MLRGPNWLNLLVIGAATGGRWVRDWEQLIPAMLEAPRRTHGDMGAAAPFVEAPMGQVCMLPLLLLGHSRYDHCTLCGQPVYLLLPLLPLRLPPLLPCGFRFRSASWRGGAPVTPGPSSSADGAGSCGLGLVSAGA